MAAAVIPAQRAPHWTCAICGFSFDRTSPGKAPELCVGCSRGSLGKVASRLARRLAGASGWQRREASLASLTVRHEAVVAILEAAVKAPVEDVERLHLALLDELTAPLIWQGTDYQRRIFQSALGRARPVKPVAVIPPAEPERTPGFRPRTVQLP